jgi:hypothetical protein
MFGSKKLRELEENQRLLLETISAVSKNVSETIRLVETLSTKVARLESELK